MLNLDFKQAIDSLQANPIACGSLCLKALEELSEGKVKIVDPSNPFVYLMETSVILYTNSLDRCGNTLTRLYPSNASNYQDLYRHMSGKDYNNRFSSPGQAPIMFFLDVEELKKKAIDVGDGTGNRKLTISRNSKIVTSDVKLTFLYPIDIIITSFNTITVKYDVTNKNPLQTIADTIIPAELRKTDRSTYLFFEVPVLQIEINSTVFSITGTQGLKKSLKFNDKFYYLRAFMRNDADATWEELTVKHNPMVIDNSKVTVIANVDTVNNSLSVQIPQVYKNLELLKENVRIDIYSTQGEVNVPLFNIQDTLFKASWQDHETTTPNKFVTAMSTFNNYKIASDGTVTGGSNGLTFTQLKTKVVNRSIVTEGFPISFSQLATGLENDGFATIMTKDNVTDREFLATKLLSNPSKYELNTTPIGSLTITHATTIDKMLENQRFDNQGGVKGSVRGNDNQLTVLPNAVYELIDGKLEIVSDLEVESLMGQRDFVDPSKLTLDILTNTLNRRKLYYCPYFMLHNYNNDKYIVKPYRLDKPKILTKSIENENLLLGYSSNIVAYNIQINKDYKGYSIYVQINPSDSLKELPIEDINLQMRISDENNRYWYWFHGTLVTPIDPNTGKPVDDYYVYVFDLPTNWAITENEELLIGNFKIPFKLNGNADIYTVVRKAGLGPQYRTEMDKAINPRLFDTWTTSTSSNFYAIVQERVRIVLGQHLKHLWRQQRPAIDQTPYSVYPTDVYATWEETVYEKDEFGNDKFTLGPNDEFNYVVKFAKGSRKYEELPNGDPDYSKPIILHAAGDAIIDDNGNPVPLNGQRGIVRNYDIVLLDGKYYFANHAKTIEYRESVKDEIDAWMDIMSEMEPELLERTTLYTHPKITEGLVRVLLDNGVERFIDSTQTLNITYTVDERIATNIAAIDEIKFTTITTLQAILSNNSTVSDSDLVKGLKDKLGDWILGVKLEGFLGNEFETVSVLDSSISLSIPKRLAITTNLELTVENDININFVTHSTLTT